MNFRITVYQIRIFQIPVKRSDTSVCPNYETQTWQDIVTNTLGYLCNIYCGVFRKIIKDMGVRITEDGNGEPEINDRINRGRAAITRLNCVLWDCDVTSKQRPIYIMQ